MKPRLLLSLLIAAAIAAVAPPSRKAESQDDQRVDLDNSLQVLFVERRDTLRELVEETQTLYNVGAQTLENLVQVHNELLRAELALATTKAERIKTCEQTVDNILKLESVIDAQFRSGTIPSAKLHCVKAARIQVEIELLREQAKRE